MKRKREASASARDIALALAILTNLTFAAIQMPLHMRSFRVPQGMSPSAIAHKYHMYHQTLARYVQWLEDDEVVKIFHLAGGLVPFDDLCVWVKRKQKRGPKRYLTAVQDMKVLIALRRWQKSGLGQNGYPVKNNIIAELMMKIAGKTKLPGRKAVKAFTVRHPPLLNKKTKQIDLARQAAATNYNLGKHWKVRYY